MTSYSILVTTGATFIRLGYTLYRFEAKTKGYNFYEDKSTQFTFDLGQICRLQNQNLNVSLVISTGFDDNNSNYKFLIEAFSDALESWNIGLKFSCFDQMLIWYGSKWNEAKNMKSQNCPRKKKTFGSQGYFGHFTCYSASIELKFYRHLYNTISYNFHVLT